jgi:hypothetical protein
MYLPLNSHVTHARVNKSALRKPCTLLVGDSRVDENNVSIEALVSIQIARFRGRDSRCHDGQDMRIEVNALWQKIDKKLAQVDDDVNLAGLQ